VVELAQANYAHRIAGARRGITASAAIGFYRVRVTQLHAQ
jgi:type IV secretory pathway protease TraF